MEERNGQYPVDPFTNSAAELSNGPLQSKNENWTQKSVFGIAVSLNHTDTYNNGYHCVDKYQVCLNV